MNAHNKSRRLLGVGLIVAALAIGFAGGLPGGGGFRMMGSSWQNVATSHR